MYVIIAGIEKWLVVPCSYSSSAWYLIVGPHDGQHLMSLRSWAWCQRQLREPNSVWRRSNRTYGMVVFESKLFDCLYNHEWS
jgi:hypothetical protein